MKQKYYQITVKVLLKKYRHHRKIEFRPVYFNSFTKTVTNHGFKLRNSFQEIIYMIDNWINEGSGQIIELSLNILTFQLIDF